MTRAQLEEFRHRGYGVYGYKSAFCHGNGCCEDCDKVVRFWCKVICKIEAIQTWRILKVCKSEAALSERGGEDG